jgi:hypothetical protein
MVSIEKRETSGYGSAIVGPIGFIVHPEVPDQEEVRVELSLVQAGNLTLRLIDSQGHRLMEQTEWLDPEQEQLIVTVHDLPVGTYFFEVTNGFFHQIKELRIPPAVDSYVSYPS